MLKTIYRIPFRIFLIVAVAAGFATVLTLVLLSRMQDAAYDLRQEALAEEMDIVVSLLEDLHARAEAGVLSEEEARRRALDMLDAIRFGENGYFVVQDTDLIMLAHPFLPDLVGTDQSGLTDARGLRISQVMRDLALDRGEGAQRYWFAKPGSSVPEEKIGYVYHFEPWDMILSTGAYVSDITAEMATLRSFVFGALAIGIAALLAVSWLLGRSVTRPLNHFMRSMYAVAEGDHDSDIAVARRPDEIGDLGQELVRFRDRLRDSDAQSREREAESVEQARVVAELSQGLACLSKGDLCFTIDGAFPPAYEGLRHDYNETVNTLDELISAVVENTHGIRSRAEEISSASLDLSRRTESQAATLEQTAAAMDELTASVGSAAENAGEVARAMDAARNSASQSGEVVSRSVGAMSQIKESSDSISRIIALIDDIAFQTNLLALNAGVEAARAGDSGRGFAVVAAEVRALAQRSSDAAQEISQLVNKSSEHVDTGVMEVNKTGEVLRDIVKRVTTVADLVQGIADGAKEQSAGISEINVGVTQLDQVTQQNAAMVEQTTAAGMALKEDAGILGGLMGHFRLRGSAPGGAAPVAAPEPSPLSGPPPEPARPTGWDAGMTPEVAPSPPAPAPRARASAAGGGASAWQDF